MAIDTPAPPIDQASDSRNVSLVWGIADDVRREPFKRGKYPGVILPMFTIRLMDAALRDTKQAVLETKQLLVDAKLTE